MQAPRPISVTDALDDFDCGAETLNLWLKQRALQNETSGASRTFVLEENGRIIGYYTLTAGSVAHAIAPGKIRRNMPDPLPVAILGRLAVDKTCQSGGIGRDLLRDAAIRVIHAAETLGIRALLIHALSERARRFYERYGFQRSQFDEMTLMATLPDLQKAFG
ncbi:GNAT family N-acetyltransferase [Asticcacaulis solisilvae]|uniref:GNAT family N-acetyltransferase n=1 Tax=Asticcacaulis solisilvae TaxID=1217274 RepID=UPI003FD7341F